MKIETFFTWLCAFVITIVIILIAFVMMQNLNQVPEEYCIEDGGTPTFYECQTILGGTPCSELKTGFWCEYPDGSSKSEAEIWRLINSTV